MCKFARRGGGPVRKWFSRDRVRRESLNPGRWIVGSVTVVWLITERDNQSSLHCVIVSTNVMSDHIGGQDASCRGGCSKTSAYTDQFGWPFDDLKHPEPGATPGTVLVKQKLTVVAEDSELRCYYACMCMCVCSESSTASTLVA